MTMRGPDLPDDLDDDWQEPETLSESDLVARRLQRELDDIDAALDGLSDLINELFSWRFMIMVITGLGLIGCCGLGGLL